MPRRTTTPEAHTDYRPASSLPITPPPAQIELEPETGRAATVRAGIWTLADQAMVSFANFSLMVLLARELPATQFGTFVLVYMAVYLCHNIQTAMITRPHNVMAATLTGADFRAHTGTSLSLQIFMVSIIAGLGVLALLGSLPLDLSLAQLIAATTIAIVALQLQEFSRQVQFTVGRSDLVFRYDLICYGGEVILLVSLLIAGALTGVTAMLALALSAGMAALYGYHRNGIRPTGSALAGVRRNWEMARWVLGDNLGQWLSTMLFPILTAVFAGPAATAAFRMLLNVVGPLQIIFNAVPSFGAARATRAYHEGGFRRLLAFLIPVIVIVGIPVGGFLLLVSIFDNEVMRLMYGAAGQEHAQLIALLASAYVVQYLTSTTSIGLLATDNARAIFIARLAGIALTLTAGVWATATFGLTGALAGLLLTNTGLLLVLVILFAKGPRRQAGTTNEAVSLRIARGES